MFVNLVAGQTTKENQINDKGLEEKASQSNHHTLVGRLVEFTFAAHIRLPK